MFNACPQILLDLHFGKSINNNVETNLSINDDLGLITAIQFSCLCPTCISQTCYLPYMYFSNSLFNNLSSINRGSPDCNGIWISHLNWHIFLQNLSSIFLLVLSLIEKIYKSLKTLFDHINFETPRSLSKILRYASYHIILYSLLGVWRCGQTHSSSLIYYLIHVGLS